MEPYSLDELAEFDGYFVDVESDGPSEEDMNWYIETMYVDPAEVEDHL